MTANAVMSLVSRQYVTVENISAFHVNAPDASTNVTTLTVEFAFKASSSDPVTGDWHAGIWLGTSAKPAAAVLVGIGGVVLAAGQYTVWIRITGAIEQPVWNVGSLRIR
jgi:hypothetical protein